MRKLIFISFLFVGTLKGQDSLQNKVKEYAGHKVIVVALRGISIPFFYGASKSKDPKFLIYCGAMLQLFAYGLELESEIKLYK